MANYNWQHMAHDLATEVMGWEYEEVPTKSDNIYSGNEDKSWQIEENDWKPHEDLNQAWMLVKEVPHYVTISDNGKTNDVEVDDTGFGSKWARHKDPAKAILLVVTKASELNLSYYEVEDE